MNKEELLKQRDAVQDAINNVLTAGQEFQTRTSRTKLASLSELRSQLADINSQLASYENSGMTDTVKLKFGGW